MENIFGELPVRRLHQLVAVMPEAVAAAAAAAGGDAGAGAGPAGGARRAGEVRLWLAEPLPDPLPALAPVGPPYATWLSKVHLRHALRCAVEAGRTREGRRVFVARAEFRGRLLPARVEERAHGALFAYRGHEWTSYRYEVLAVPRGRPEWYEASDGESPAHAFPACPSALGETLFIGRARVGGALLPGRVLESEGGCTISFRGKEHFFREYEVLSIM